MISRKFLLRGSWLAAFAVLLLQLSVFAHACEGWSEARAKCPDHAASAPCKTHCDASASAKLSTALADVSPASVPAFSAPVADFAPVFASPPAPGPAARAAPPPAYILLLAYRS